MRLKSELYKKEQDEIIEQIIKILDLENKNTYTQKAESILGRMFIILF